MRAWMQRLHDGWHSSANAQWRLRMDQRWFRHRRAAYFSYLAALLEGLQGSRTLRDIFSDDVVRYGVSHPRGRLAVQWIKRYEISGGSLFDAWHDCVPHQELAAIGDAQQLGNLALGQALSDLAGIVRREDESKAYVRLTLMAAWASLLVLGLVLAAIPAFSLPRLIDTFSTVPVEHYGPSTRALQGLAAYLSAYWWLVLFILIAVVQLMRWSLPAYCGSVRRVLDRLPPWSLYRYRYSLSFLSRLQLALQLQGSSRVLLRQALLRQRVHAVPWAEAHLKDMLAWLDSGAAGAAVFDTHLLDQEHFWFLDDMVRARGMADGLHLTVKRLEKSLMETIRHQAVVLRWVLLLSCVLTILGTVLWHYAVIDEFRHVIMLLHSV